MDENSDHEVLSAANEGAPEWMVTFADLMSLLLCFFVLLLSFSEIDRLKYKEVAGSLAKAFGVQRKIHAYDPPKGMKLIARDFDQALVTTQQREATVHGRESEVIGEKLRNEVRSRFQAIEDLVEVAVNGDQVEIRLMGESTFESGKAQIRSEMMPLLDKIAAALKDTRGEIVIRGHTDNVPISGGPFRSNLQLSIARATRSLILPPGFKNSALA